jgi:hypothetical protein
MGAATIADVPPVVMTLGTLPARRGAVKADMAGGAATSRERQRAGSYKPLASARGGPERAASASERGCYEPRAGARGRMTNPPPFRSGLVTWEPLPSGRCVVAPLRCANHGTRHRGESPRSRFRAPLGRLAVAPGAAASFAASPGLGVPLKTWAWLHASTMAGPIRRCPYPEDSMVPRARRCDSSALCPQPSVFPRRRGCDTDDLGGTRPQKPASPKSSGRSIPRACRKRRGCAPGY